jgi:hypothetical protein
MRLWSLHPRYLDRTGLVALWRESLLAQAVLRGATRGYRRHPQLARFRNHSDPEGAIAAYLDGVYREALRRGYRFDATKIGDRRAELPIAVTRGQLRYERQHLLKKLLARHPDCSKALQAVDEPEPHPLFMAAPGEVEAWERAREKKRSESRMAGMRNPPPSDP